MQTNYILTVGKKAFRPRSKKSSLPLYYCLGRLTTLGLTDFPVWCCAEPIKCSNLPTHNLCSVNQINYKLFTDRFSLSIFSTSDHDPVIFLFITLQAWIYFNSFSFPKETVVSVWSYID